MKANTSGVNECLHLEVADSEGHGDSCGTALCRRQQVTKTFSNIRRAERKMIRELLATGGVVQVFGPPMVGKASIVQQVVQELQMGSPEVKSHVIPSRHQTLSDVLNHLMSRICPNTVIDPEPDFNDSSNRERMVQEIRTSLNHDNHYLLVFKKCEGLKAAESEFLTWVGSLTDLWRSHDIKVSIILTTYKQFRMTRRDVSLVEVGVLTDADDISTLLQDTAPGVRDDQLIPVCRRSLCLPECVVTLARECVARECVAKECVARECVAKECVTKECVARECVAKECVAKECVAKESVARECVAINCLTNEATRLSTEMVELVVPTDSMFPDVFVARLMDVETWVSRDDLQLLLMPGQATFQPEALLEHVNCKHPDEKVKDLLHRYAYVIEPNRYRLHPLLTFYCHTFPILQAGTTSQRFTLGNRQNRYLQYILGMAELYTQLNGRPGHAYGCLQQEWPETRDLIKQAAISQADTYLTFLEVAVKARRLLVATDTNMAKDFYSTLLQEAKRRGTPGQCAVLLGVCGHLTAQGAGANLQQAGEMLDSAIDSLKQNGVRYFLKCALVRKAIVLFRQGDHPHSLEYFSKARSMTAISEECTDPFLKVSKLQEEEEDLTAEIYETIPMIFSGNNVEAREQLNQLRRKLKEKSFDHPELSTLLNNIGLTCQRGNKDSRAALKWYKKAYLERRHLEKICPESLVVMLNNIGMIHYELKELDTAKTYIRKAVEIGRRSRWPHSNTALAFVHLSIINFKEKNFMETLRLLVEADTMMLTIGRNYEFRLRITESLLHVRVIISQLGLTPGAGESEDVERLLKKSAADILRDLLAIGSTVKGHLSDEGHSRMLAAYEHGIILHWNVLEEREQYKQELLHYAHANGWVRSVLLSNKDITRSKSEQLVKHRPLYDYLVRTEDLQLSEVTRHVFDTCTYCAIVRQYYTDQIWSNHVQQQQMVARG